MCGFSCEDSSPTAFARLLCVCLFCFWLEDAEIITCITYSVCVYSHRLLWVHHSRVLLEGETKGARSFQIGHSYLSEISDWLTLPVPFSTDDVIHAGLLISLPLPFSTPGSFLLKKLANQTTAGTFVSSAAYFIYLCGFRSPSCVYSGVLDKKKNRSDLSRHSLLLRACFKSIR